MTDQRAADPSASPGAKTRPGRSMNPALRLGLIGGGLVVAVVLLILLFGWWTHGRFVQSTNDAYVHADQVTISPKVSGYVEEVYVVDNQAVAAGQPLVRIDAGSYDAALAAQKATVLARSADIEAARRQISQQQAAVEQAADQLKGGQADARYAAREAERYRGLSQKGVETEQRYAQAVNQSDEANVALRKDGAALTQARLQVSTFKAQLGQAEAQLEAAKAEVQTAQINAADTVLRATAAGRVGDKSVRVGQLVQPGARLMSVVPVSQIYLVGNFKETQIGRMRTGQRATIKIDAFSGRKIDATLQSFAPGTGAQFALLPPENATGNFTKVVQRVPVRFALKPPADLADRLLPGLSATVTVDTTQSADTER